VVARTVSINQNSLLLRQQRQMPPLARPGRIQQPKDDVAARNKTAIVPSTPSRVNSGIDLKFTLRNGKPVFATLTSAFKKQSFRGCQREVIEAALEGISHTTFYNDRSRCVCSCADWNGQVAVLSASGRRG
jgi:hypothetical protein